MVARDMVDAWNALRAGDVPPRLVHAIDGSLGGVRSDLVTMEWIRDRFVHTVDPVTRTLIDTLVRDLGTAVIDHDLEAAVDMARSLGKVLAALG